jgi:la-related protein 1
MTPFTSLSPTRPIFGNAPPVMWAKNQTQQVPILDSKSPYTLIRDRALEGRRLSPTGEPHSDMKILYDFWSHFLIRNFNPQMYLEFKDLAFDDAIHRQDNTGIKKLIQFYDEILNKRQRIIPEVFARHYVDLVRSEDPTKERPGFTKLRASWRDGAVEMKSRKRIQDLLDPKLREELER